MQFDHLHSAIPEVSALYHRTLWTASGPSWPSHASCKTRSALTRPGTATSQRTITRASTRSPASASSSCWRRASHRWVVIMLATGLTQVGGYHAGDRPHTGGWSSCWWRASHRWVVIMLTTGLKQVGGHHASDGPHKGQGTSESQPRHRLWTDKYRPGIMLGW